MKRTTWAFLLFAALSYGQSSQTIALRATMLPSNETPPITDLNARGDGTFYVHILRDSTGAITSGSVDFNVSGTFPGDINVTGFHFHKGAAGVAGPVVIDSGISATSPIAFPGGVFSISRQAQVSNSAGLDALTGIAQDPSGFYVNLHTTVNPAGAIRAQLQRADMTVLLAQMSPANETPPITGLAASGLAAVTVLTTTDATGKVTSGQATLTVNYSGFSDDTMFTGFHIHKGAAGVAGPVVLNSGLAATAPVPVVAGGTGTLSYIVPVAPDNANAIAVLQGLVTNPGAFYINLHTTVNTGGAIRAQLRTADKVTFPMTLSPANETPPVTGLAASATGQYTVYSIRNADGTVANAAAIFDFNPRFPSATTVTGLHMHTGAAGVAGPVVIDSGISATAPVTLDTGVGNIYRTALVTKDAGVAAVNTLLANPENHYVNLHTTVNPAGAVRSQLTAANTALPTIAFVGSASGDNKATQLAPGELIYISGTNLAKVGGDLSGFAGSTLPTAINGVSVSIAGKATPLFATSSGLVVGQIPFDVPVGPATLTLTTPNGSVSAQNVNIVAAAPSIFVDQNGVGIIEKNSDFTIVSSTNPVTIGDVVVVYSTGLGQTTPASATGVIAGNAAPFNNTGTTTATVGGVPAFVYYSILSPGFTGLYQTAILIPAGVPSGSASVQITTAGVASNIVKIAIK